MSVFSTADDAGTTNRAWVAIMSLLISNSFDEATVRAVDRTRMRIEMICYDGEHLRLSHKQTEHGIVMLLLLVLES